MPGAVHPPQSKQSENHGSLAGFTLLEMLLSVAMIAIIATIGLSINTVSVNSAELANAKTTLVQGLRAAQLRATTSKHDSAWGVRLQGTDVIIFAGNSYAARNAVYDEVYSQSGRVSFTGLVEVVFAQAAGTTVNTGSITVSTSNGSDTISLTSAGVIND